MAEACIFLAENYNSDEPINVGTGKEISIKKDFAKLVKKTVNLVKYVLIKLNRMESTENY